MVLTEPQAKEIVTLRKTATTVVSWLAILTIGSIAFEVALLAERIGGSAAVQQVLLCIVGGTLGSSISALISAAERISHGWELSEGIKYPDPQPVDKFVARMVPFFVVRPFLGSAMGLVVYAGITGGYLIAAQNPDKATFSREGLLFLAFLGGLFAKTFMEKLRAMFDALFGKK